MSLSGNRLGVRMRRIAFTCKRLNAFKSTCRIFCNLTLVPVVSERGSYVLFYKNFITYRAVLALGKSGFGTGSGLCGVDNFGMSLCLNSFGIGMRRIALTCERLNAVYSTCCILCNSALVPVVSERGSYVLFYENGITYRAVFALGKSGFGTGRSLCGIDNFRMTVSLNNRFKSISAVRADLDIISVMRTVGRNSLGFLHMMNVGYRMSRYACGAICTHTFFRMILAVTVILPFGVIMSECIFKIIVVRISAFRACIGGKSFIKTCRFYGNGCKFTVLGIEMIICVTCTAGTFTLVAMSFIGIRFGG